MFGINPLIANIRKSNVAQEMEKSIYSNLILEHLKKWQSNEKGGEEGNKYHVLFHKHLI